NGPVGNAALAERLQWNTAFVVKRLLIEIRQQPRHPAPGRGIRPGAVLAAESVVREPFFLIVIGMDRERELPQIAGAMGLVSRGPDLLNGGQEQTEENRNDEK